MIDVGGKPVCRREATARGKVVMQTSTVNLIKEGKVPKGDVIESARTAAIFAIKKVPELIPLCHPVKITWADIGFDLKKSSIQIQATVRGVDRTGVEMEAITAVSVAALTIYDMCKTVDKNILINDIQLVEKRKQEVT